MDIENQLTPPLRFLIGGACIVIIVAGMKAAASILNIVLLAFLLAQSINALPNWFMKKRLSSGLAVLLTLLIVIIGGLAVLLLFGTSIAGLMEKLPTYQAKLTRLWDGVGAFLSARGVGISKLAPLERVKPDQIVQIAGALLGAVAQTLGNGLLLLIIIVFMLLEFAAMHQKLSSGEVPQGSLLRRFEEINKDNRKYVAITGLAGLIQAIANVLVLGILGVDFAITWGVLFFFFNFVPTFGFFMALIPPLLVALLDYGWQKALLVLVSWSVINFIFDNVVKPKFMKKGLDIPFLLIILGLIFWSWVLGPVGAILAVPLTLIAKNLVLQYSAGGHSNEVVTPVSDGHGSGGK
jgi:predicted PurR-regulated permease PerM